MGREHVEIVGPLLSVGNDGKTDPVQAVRLLGTEEERGVLTPIDRHPHRNIIPILGGNTHRRGQDERLTRCRGDANPVRLGRELRPARACQPRALPAKSKFALAAAAGMGISMIRM